MDQYEECFEKEEVEVEIGQKEVVVSVVTPQRVNIPLEVRVAPVAGSTESPSSSPSPPTPSARVTSASQQSPIGNAPPFVRLYTIMILLI